MNYRSDIASAIQRLGSGTYLAVRLGLRRYLSFPSHRRNKELVRRAIKREVHRLTHRVAALLDPQRTDQRYK